MPQLFTVRWPLLARLEAILFLPFVLKLASETAPVRNYVDHVLVPTLSPTCSQMGIPDQAIFCLALALVVTVPYVVMLIAADRFLTIRKGYALLSVLGIAGWTGIAIRMPWLLTGLIPRTMLAGTEWLSPDLEVALGVGGLALLVHLRPLWIGLADDGDVAWRLLATGHAEVWQAGTENSDRRDVYSRQTASFREWRRPQEQLEGFGAGPRENSAVKALYAITWVGVLVGCGAAYLNWNGIIDLRHDKDKADAGPAGASSPLKPGTGTKAVASAPMPVVQSAPAMPMVNSRVVVAAPLPTVQRPTEVSANMQSPSTINGANEAVAERGTDGSFAFDAVVNGGAHVRMLFDTGASVVGLRAEDAVRIGIPVTRLDYSAKIKTANGTADVAPVLIGSMMIGNITLRNVPGFVAKQGMLQENLLGQTFLERLAGFNVEKNLLILKGH